jgi:hypothetical protein
MHTVNASPEPFTTELRTPTTIDRSSAADEPSHIHLPRPSRDLRPAAVAAPVTEPRR